MFDKGEMVVLALVSGVFLLLGALIAVQIRDRREQSRRLDRFQRKFFAVDSDGGAIPATISDDHFDISA